MNENKIRAFEYIVIQLAKLHLGKSLDDTLNQVDINRFNENNDFSKLKLLKLLFLICAVLPTKPLLVVFNRFYAMQYGPVELDIYSAIDEDRLTFLTISDRNTLINGDIMVLEGSIDEHLRNEIDTSIKGMTSNNHTIVETKHWDLVEITHRYGSWIDAFSKAKVFSRNSFPMQKTQILRDENVFNVEKNRRYGKFL